MTFAIERSVYRVNGNTRIIRGREPATFADILKHPPVIVGDYKTDAKGERTASMIRIIDVPGAPPGRVLSVNRGFFGVVSSVDPTALTLTLGTDPTKFIALPSTPVDGKLAAFTNIVAGIRIRGDVIPDAGGEIYLVWVSMMDCP
jgi:hypothetical protein